MEMSNINHLFDEIRRDFHLYSINKQFAFYDVTLKYDIFDNDTFIKNNTGYYVTVTNVETGKAEYLEMKDVLKEMEILRATSAIPCVSQIVEWNGKKYLDGGIADSIPVLKCKEMGYEKIIVVLTKPLSYRKKKRPAFIAKMFYKKNPNLVNAINTRYIKYNETLDIIIDMENKKEIFVFRPSKDLKIKRIEKNTDKLQEMYDLGVKDFQDNLKALKKYLKS